MHTSPQPFPLSLTSSLFPALPLPPAPFLYLPQSAFSDSVCLCLHGTHNTAAQLHIRVLCVLFGCLCVCRCVLCSRRSAAHEAFRQDSATTTTCCVRQPVTHTHDYRYICNSRIQIEHRDEGSRQQGEAFVSHIACCILYVCGMWQVASGEGIPLTQITQSRAAARVHPSDTLQTTAAQEQSVQYSTDMRGRWR